MSSSEHQAPSAATNTLKEEPLKLAVAISLLRSKFLQRHPPPPSLSDDALKWKRKAKERKQEILKLKDDLKEAEEASQCDIFPQTASCKCYFFDNLGKLSPNRLGDGSDRRFHDVLRRRFLRQVRLRERRRTCGSSQKRRALGFSDEDHAEQLRASVDFLVELCSSSSPRHIAGVFEEWVTSLLQARKSVEVLERRNGLYVQYMDRVVGELSKLVGQSPALLKLNS
ncbi:hypothetical protein Godav_001821, partial [Gossypium davidsonii]|nr:hypothetical protein [Gossypium davidsonii]MBA0668991.1 hypothetical protein [Gossypium klotzschianum]